MVEQDAGDVTPLIRATREGDRAAKDQLFTLVYSELQRVVARRPGVGQKDETMQVTAKPGL